MTSVLAAGAGTIGVLLSSGLALAQPASVLPRANHFSKPNTGMT
jgi:hypothetical protein